MEKKMTYAMAIDKAMEVVTDEEVKARLGELKNSLAKKSSKSGEKKISDYDVALRTAVAEMLSEKPMTCSEMIALGTLPTNESGVLSTQKIVSVCKAIGAVATKGEKGKTYYSLAVAETTEE